MIKGVTGFLTVPLGMCEIRCNLFDGQAQVGIVDSLPEKGVNLILSNDLV